MTTRGPSLKKIIAGILAASVFAVSPGLASYAAAAEVVKPAAPIQPTPIIQIGTSGLNVLKGAGALPTTPGALGIDPTQRTVPVLPQAALPGTSDVRPDSLLIQPQTGDPAVMSPSKIADAVAPRLEAIAKPQTSGEGASGAGHEVTEILQGGRVTPASETGVQETVPATEGSGLSPASPHETTLGQKTPPPTPPSPTKKAARPKLVAFAVTVLRTAAAAGAVYGLHALAVFALPAVFGVVPVAAVWAIASGGLLLPAALYTRHRLAKRDSPALKPVKLVLDLAIGAYLGGLLIAAPAFSTALFTNVTAVGMGLSAGSSLLTVLAAAGGGKTLDWLATGASLAGLPLLVGTAAVGSIALAPLLGMMALPVMTTVSFFLGSIIRSAETGRPFSIPGTLQKIRFPAFNWVMMGVVFALTSGYGAVLTNVAFAAWTLFGNKGNEDAKAAETGRPFWQNALIAMSVSLFGSSWAEKLYNFAKRIAETKTFKVVKKIAGFVLNFNRLYAGLFVYTALTGFASPLTFLVIAFAPERAAHWTERLLRKLFPGKKAEPSSVQPHEDHDNLLGTVKDRMPSAYHWLKTGAIIAVMLGAGFFMGATVFGFAALGKNLIVAAALTIPQLLLSRWLVKKLMKAQPATPENMPKYHAVFSEVVDEVLGLVNARRAAKGKKAIPTPEKVRVPLDLPNAFATGPGPSHATIGVTDGIMEMLLDPQNAREGLLRLVQSVDPQSKSFNVFRAAIAGSVPGLSGNATANEVSQALVRASDLQIQALGRRMLRGVLGHEFSHVTDRHMLTGSVAGALSSAVAFASYGVMWGVGHAKGGVRRLLGRNLRGERGTPEARARELSIESAKPQGAVVEALDPATAAAAIRSLPALLRVFAALWGPTILQIIQMAGSRNNESQADRDGAALTDDPEALALALGMLTTWKPKPGFAIEWSRMPRLAALSQFMTVNPLDQLRAAGVMPKDDALPAWASDKRDDWMFNLWVTHPDTTKRIETLHDFGAAIHDPKTFAFRPALTPGQGTGSQAPPAFAATATEKKGFFRKIWDKISTLYHVLPDKARNGEFWKFVWSQALINLGINFHYTALTKMVDPKDDQPQRVLYNRAVNSGSQLTSSIATGGAVDRYSVQKLLIWSHLGRSLMLLAVPVLFYMGALPFVAFQVIVFATGFLQSLSMTAGSVAFNRILAEDTAYYNKANAVFNLIVSIVGIVGPLMAGAFIVYLNAHLGFLSGNALSYGVYGALLLGATMIFRKLRIPRDELLQARRDLWDQIKKKTGQTFWKMLLGLFVAGAATGPVIKGVNAARVNGKPVLLVEVKGDPAEVKDIPAEFQGYPVKVEKARKVWRELAEGFRLIWSNRFLKIYLLFSTVSAFMADPIVFSAIPRYIEGVLHTPPAAQGGVFGLYMAATGLGTGLASFILMLARDRSESDLEAALAASKKGLLAAGLDEEKAENALEAVRQAKLALLARYRARWAAEADWSPSEVQFQQELAAEAASQINSRALSNAKSDAELAALLRDSSLGERLWAWSGRHAARAMKDARTQARTGLTPMERQGRWSSWLNGLGWILYWGVFFVPGLHLSLGVLVVASMLQAPAMAIWSALVQHVLGTKYPESMGKIYASINFYTLAFAILGPIVFGPLVKALSVGWVLGLACAATTIMGLLDIIQPSKSFPLDKRPNP